MVLAAGNPLGLTGSVTDGIISAAGRVVPEPGPDGPVLPDAIQAIANLTRALAARDPPAAPSRLPSSVTVRR